MNEITQRGIAVLKTGDRSAARQLLEQAVQQDPQDATAWLWLSGAVDADEQRILCLRQVLRIEPDNQAAARGLEIVLAKGARRPAPPPKVETAQPAQAAPQEEPAPQGEPAIQVAAAAPADSALQVETAQPVEAAPQIAAGPPSDAVFSNPARARHAPQSAAAPQVIFRTRSSLVPALGGFWLFFAGAYLLSVLVSGLGAPGSLFAAGVGLALELVVLASAARILLTRYELTTHYLLLRHLGRKVRVPVGSLYHVEASQTFFQKFLGTADIRVDGAVDGQLARLCLKNVPGFQRYVELIRPFTSADE